MVKQTMVDSSCRVLTSDIFQGCNKLVRLCGWRKVKWSKGLCTNEAGALKGFTTVTLFLASS